MHRHQTRMILIMASLIIPFFAAGALAEEAAFPDPRRIRLLAKTAKPQSDFQKLQNILEKFSQADGAILKEWILLDWELIETESFDYKALIKAFASAFPNYKMEMRRGYLPITKVLDLKIKVNGQNPKELERFLEENKMMIVLPWNLWLRAPWDPRQTLNEEEQTMQLELRKWVAHEIDKLPSEQKIYIQNVYRGPYTIDSRLKIPPKLRALFPPQCPRDSRDKMKSYKCLSQWNLHVGSFLGQLPISKSKIDPESQVAMPEMNDLKFFGSMHISHSTALQIEAQPSFSRTPSGVKALIAYLSRRGMQVELIPEWRTYIPK